LSSVTGYGLPNNQTGETTDEDVIILYPQEDGNGDYSDGGMPWGGYLEFQISKDWFRKNGLWIVDYNMDSTTNSTLYLTQIPSSNSDYPTYGQVTNDNDNPVVAGGKLT